jgi:hypothetical protein
LFGEREKMLIGITGSLGSGKTLYMTRCLYKEKLKREDCRLITNYKLNEVPFEYIDASELFEMKEKLKNTIIGIDEFHIFLDSRSSLTKKSKLLTYFILQSRHLGVHLYFTTQDIGQVDIRLRRMLDLLVYCRKTYVDDYFKIRLIDYRDTMDIKQNEFIFHGQPYYDLYDTTEIVDIQ